MAAGSGAAPPLGRVGVSASAARRRRCSKVASAPLRGVAGASDCCQPLRSHWAASIMGIEVVLTALMLTLRILFIQ